MARIIVLLSLFGLVLAPLPAEQVYELDLQKDLALSATSLGAFAAGYLLPENTGDQAARDSINAIDRSAMFPHGTTLDDIATVTSGTALLLPILSVTGHRDDPSVLGTYAVMYTEAFLLTGGVKNMLKRSVSRWRPFTYEENFVPGTDGDDDYRDSFPSGHTAYAFLGATFATVTFSREYPDSPWRVPLIAAAYSLAAGTGALRVLSGDHFMTDVAAGAVIGALCGWLIPTLHETLGESSADLRITPTIAGLDIRVDY